MNQIRFHSCERKNHLFVKLPIHQHYYGLKEFPYFRNLLKKYPPSFLREILPFFVWKIKDSYLDHDQFIYVPIQPCEYEIGIPLSDGSKLKNAITMFKLTKHTHEILKNLLPLQHRLFSSMTLSQKFWMLSESIWYRCYFNRYLIKKGQPFHALVITLHGEFKQVQKQIVNVRLSRGIQIYGPEQTDKQFHWNLTIKSNSNQCLALVIEKEILMKYIGFKINDYVRDDIKIPLKLQTQELIKRRQSSGSIYQQKQYNNGNFIQRNLLKLPIRRVQSQNSIKEFYKRCKDYESRNGSTQTIQCYFQQNLALLHLRKRSKEKLKSEKTMMNSSEQFKLKSLFEQFPQKRNKRLTKAKQFPKQIKKNKTQLKDCSNILTKILLQKFKRIKIKPKFTRY